MPKTQDPNVKPMQSMLEMEALDVYFKIHQGMAQKNENCNLGS